MPAVRCRHGTGVGPATARLVLADAADHTAGAGDAGAYQLGHGHVGDGLDHEVAITSIAAGAGIAGAIAGFYRKPWAANASLVGACGIWLLHVMVQPISKDEAGYSPAMEAQ